MKHYKKTTTIIISILIIAWIGFGFIFNACFFHKKAIPDIEGHYEPQVYITASGKCYHSDMCSYVKEIYAIGLYQAETQGYRACLHCGGSASGTIWIAGTPKQETKNNYILSFTLSFILIAIIGIKLLTKLTKNNCIDNNT